MPVTQYIGARYVPIMADPIEWSSTKTYEPLTIVINEGNSYTSRQFVPVGIDILNDQYWALTGNYNAQVESYRQEVARFNGRIETIENALPISAFDDNDTVQSVIAREASLVNKIGYSHWVDAYRTDSNTDDDAIAACIAANPNSTVYFSPRDYHITQPIVIPCDNAHMVSIDFNFAHVYVDSSLTTAAIRITSDSAISRRTLNRVPRRFSNGFIIAESQCVYGFVVEHICMNITLDNMILYGFNTCYSQIETISYADKYSGEFMIRDSFFWGAPSNSGANLIETDTLDNDIVNCELWGGLNCVYVANGGSINLSEIHALNVMHDPEGNEYPLFQETLPYTSFVRVKGSINKIRCTKIYCDNFAHFLYLESDAQGPFDISASHMFSGASSDDPNPNFYRLVYSESQQNSVRMNVRDCYFRAYPNYSIPIEYTNINNYQEEFLTCHDNMIFVSDMETYINNECPSVFSAYSHQRYMEKCRGAYSLTSDTWVLYAIVLGTSTTLTRFNMGLAFGTHSKENIIDIFMSYEASGRTEFRCSTIRKEEAFTIDIGYRVVTKGGFRYVYIYLRGNLSQFFNRIAYCSSRVIAPMDTSQRNFFGTTSTPTDSVTVTETM